MTRKWTEDDTLQVMEIHQEMGIPYQMPDVSNPLFAIKRVLVDDRGKIIGAGAIKPVGECFLWVRPSMMPIFRARAVKRLTAEGMLLAGQSGLDELTAWIHPEVEREFGRPLTKLGFVMSPWRSWSTKI